MENPVLETLRKLFFSKEEVHKHWYSLVDNFEHSSDEFYKKIEKELESRKVPGLELSRVEFSEGGPLSHKREYLRIRRERLVFDVCAAPFGTSYFFSFRFVELPLAVRLWELAAVAGCLSVTFWMLARVCGTIPSLVILGVVVAVSILFMANAAQPGMNDMDAMLMKQPVIGPLYEIFFRKETYYREDTRLMYLTTVNGIAEKAVEEATNAKGIRLLKRYDRKPVLGELYQERPVPAAEPPRLMAA